MLRYVCIICLFYTKYVSVVIYFHADPIYFSQPAFVLHVVARREIRLVYVVNGVDCSSTEKAVHLAVGIRARRTKPSAPILYSIYSSMYELGNTAVYAEKHDGLMR